MISALRSITGLSSNTHSCQLINIRTIRAGILITLPLQKKCQKIKMLLKHLKTLIKSVRINLKKRRYLITKWDIIFIKTRDTKI